MRSFSKVLCGLLSFAIGSAAADLAAGVRAYDNKEFAKAAGELMPLAEGGDSTAQYYIGSMNSSGKGCRRIIRLESSRNWYSAAAERGHAHAAAMFGWLFATGPNVPWHSEVPTDLMAAQIRPGSWPIGAVGLPSSAVEPQRRISCAGWWAVPAWWRRLV